MNSYKFVGTDMLIRTKGYSAIAYGFNRIVHGGRGDYVEFTSEQFRPLGTHIPPEQVWRKFSDVCYYEELRTDGDNVKVYYQKRTVDYADYKIGMYYVSPRDLLDFEIEGKR